MPAPHFGSARIGVGGQHTSARSSAPTLSNWRELPRYALTPGSAATLAWCAASCGCAALNSEPKARVCRSTRSNSRRSAAQSGEGGEGALLWAFGGPAGRGVRCALGSTLEQARAACPEAHWRRCNALSAEPIRRRSQRARRPAGRGEGRAGQGSRQRSVSAGLRAPQLRTDGQLAADGAALCAVALHKICQVPKGACVRVSGVERQVVERVVGWG